MRFSKANAAETFHTTYTFADALRFSTGAAH